MVLSSVDFSSKKTLHIKFSFFEKAIIYTHNQFADINLTMILLYFTYSISIFYFTYKFLHLDFSHLQLTASSDCKEKVDNNSILDFIYI